MSNEHIKRIMQSINETNAIIEKAMRYSEQFRDQELISVYSKHLEKLNKMLEA